MSNTKTEDLKPTTLQEAKKTVYAKLCQNINPKEITQISFLIEDKVTRFNPAQIRKIREEFEPKIEQNNRDPDKVLTFKLFKKRVSPIDVVIQTGLPFEYVKNAYEEYCIFERMVTVPNWFYDNVMESIKVVDEKFNTVVDAKHALNKLVTAYQELKKYEYPCCICGINVPMQIEEWEEAKQHLSRWGHEECIQSQYKI